MNMVNLNKHSRKKCKNLLLRRFKYLKILTNVLLKNVIKDLERALPGSSSNIVRRPNTTIHRQLLQVMDGL